jgi:hypothetical protein
MDLFSCLNLDIQWLKNHVDIVEDFANFLIQVIKKLPNVVHHCPNEAFVLLFQFGKFVNP